MIELFTWSAAQIDGDDTPESCVFVLSCWCLRVFVCVDKGRGETVTGEDVYQRCFCKRITGTW